MSTVLAATGLAVLPLARTPRPGSLRYPWPRTCGIPCRDPGPRAPAGEAGSDYYDRASLADEYRTLPLRSPAARRRAQDIERALGAVGVMAAVLNRSLAEGSPGEGGLPLTDHARGALLDGVELLARAAQDDFHRLVRSLGEAETGKRVRTPGAD